ncbi:MAG: hypothetical protein PVH65_02315 [Chloroflexota bacterium]|jgi:hypothetical protein
MELLPAQLLPAVPHIVFGIFDLAIPNLMAWGIVAVLFLVAAWVRLPQFFNAAS